MTTTADKIERPAWANRTDCSSGYVSDVAHLRDLPECRLTKVGIDAVNFGNPGPVDLSMTMLQFNAPTDAPMVSITELGLDFHNAGDMRTLAAALLSSADEWERLTGGKQ